MGHHPGLSSKDVTAEIDLFSNRIDNYIYPVQLRYKWRRLDTQ